MFQPEVLELMIISAFAYRDVSANVSRKRSVISLASLTRVDIVENPSAVHWGDYTTSNTLDTRRAPFLDDTCDIIAPWESLGNEC